MKHTLVALLLISASTLLNAQSKGKIKGDKNVTVKQTTVEEFHSINIDERFEVSLVYNEIPSVEIEADSNLHEFIHISNSEGVLSFDETAKITSKKALHITINYNEKLQNITLSDDAELVSKSHLDIDKLYVILNNDAEATLQVKANVFNLKSSDKTKSTLNIDTNDAVFEINHNSESDIKLTAKTSNFKLYQRSTVDISGVSDKFFGNFNNSIKFKAKDLKIDLATIIAEDNCDVAIQVKEKIEISARGKSQILLYGKPKLHITAFEDQTTLQKKKL